MPYCAIVIMITPYQKFYEVLKTSATRKVYPLQMNQFLEYSHTDYDGLVKLPIKEIDDLIFNYIVSMKLKTEKTGIPNPNTYSSKLAPIQMFLEQNDVILNWKKLKRYCPPRIPLANQLAYQTEHIQKMLQLVNCPRDIAFVHLLATTGMRIGSVFKLTCGDVHYIENGAVIDVRKSKTTEYRACLTPEATTALKDYLKTRINTDKDDPLFTVRNNSRPLTDGSIKDVMKRIRNKIGLNEGKGMKSKNAYSANHAFRKRVEIVFSKVGIEPTFKKYLTNHDMTVAVIHYFKPDNESLYEEFKKAIPELTVSETARLTAKHEAEKVELKQGIPSQYKEKMESIEGQLVELQQERAKKIVEFYDDLAEKKGVDDIESIKTKLDDEQIDEIVKARETLGADPLEISPSQDMLRRKYLVSKQESVISSLKEELEILFEKVPKRKSADKMTDNEFDLLEDYEDKKLEIELAQEFLKELKKKI
jgi:integrase